MTTTRGLLAQAEEHRTRNAERIVSTTMVASIKQGGLERFQREAHNLEHVRSNRTPATIFNPATKGQVGRIDTRPEQPSQ